MNAFIIGDVHGNLDALAGLLRQVGIVNDDWERIDHDTRVVQVGDLCNCVAGSMADDARCLDHVEAWLDDYLVGNHEHPYFGGPAFGGFYRDPVIQHRLRLLNSLGIVKPCVAIDDVLVSHAGVAQGLLDESAGDLSADLFARDVQDAWRNDPTGVLFSTISRSRGGLAQVGGILWSDWSEPKNRAFSQIVGHTVGNEIRCAQEHDWFAYCIDLGAKARGSRIAGAWLRDGAVEIVVHDPAEALAA